MVTALIFGGFNGRTIDKTGFLTTDGHFRFVAGFLTADGRGYRIRFFLNHL